MYPFHISVDIIHIFIMYIYIYIYIYIYNVGKTMLFYLKNDWAWDFHITSQNMVMTGGW